MSETSDRLAALRAALEDDAGIDELELSADDAQFLLDTIDRLRRALKPFAAMADVVSIPKGRDLRAIALATHSAPDGDTRITYADVLAARDALNGQR